MNGCKGLVWFGCILLFVLPAAAQNPSVTDLENRISTTWAGKSAASVDKPALRELNTLKLQLLNALMAECAGLEKDAANHEISDRGRAAIQAAIKQNQDEQTSVNDSLGAWTTGLEPQAAPASAPTSPPPATAPSPTGAGPAITSVSPDPAVASNNHSPVPDHVAASANEAPAAPARVADPHTPNTDKPIATASTDPPKTDDNQGKAGETDSTHTGNPASTDGTAGSSDHPDSKAGAIVIGGAEYAGYSSQAQTTNGFLSIFYQGPLSSINLRGWTRIRLTSAAQPATNSVGSVISNPSGLMKQDFSNVGQVLDYVLGPSWHIPRTDYWSLIGEFGAITPLSSQNVPLTFTAPDVNTNECTTLLNRFSAKNGYNPPLPANTAMPATTCLASPYKYIAFSNQDRTNFYLKYGAGIRSWYPFKSPACKTDPSSADCTVSVAVIDATFGQDSSITGGNLVGVVFKLDGILPIPTGNTGSLLYLFGSSYIRLHRNQNFPPLLLQSPNPPITVPADNVFVLPLVQPNRDYYRLGVGLNINQLWCKSFGSGCPTTSQDNGTTNPAPTITSLDPPNATAGATVDLPLTINGTNFVSGSQVKWNGKALTGVQFVSDVKLTVSVPKANLAKAGPAQITVSNPAPGGGTSKASTYPIK